MSGRTPPRFVPTLTTVLEPGADPAAVPVPVPAPASRPAAEVAVDAGPSAAAAPSPQVALSDEESFRLEEQLLHRVLQRVDLSLEERLSDTVSAVVRQQLDTLMPRLRDEIENVLRALVSEALAHELSDRTGSMRAFDP